MASDNPETFADLDGHQTIFDPALENYPTNTGGSANEDYVVKVYLWSFFQIVHHTRAPDQTKQQEQTNQLRAQQENDHPVHEAAVVNKTTAPDANGNSNQVEVLYAKAKSTSGKSEIGGQLGTGAVNVTIDTGAHGPIQGEVNVQGATADANGHIGKGGLGAGANARLSQYSGQISFSVGDRTVTFSGSVSLIGVGASAHVDWSHGFSAGGGAILLLAGASLNVSVTGGN